MKPLKLFFVYGKIFILFTAVYILLFRTPIFNFQKVLFYRGISLLFLTFILFILIILFANRSYEVNLETLIAAIIVSLSINLSLFVVFPVTFERSVTTYLLDTLKNNGNSSCRGLTKPQLETKLIDDYIVKKKAIDKRVYEQKTINFIKEENKCIQLTKSALNFLKFKDIISKIYYLK